MENISIEKMEIKRFNALLMRTVISALFMGWLVWWIYCMDNNENTIVMNYINIFINLIFMVTTWRTSTMLEKIKNDKRLSEALDSELYSLYNYKSLATGFYTALICGLLVFFFGEYFNLSVRTSTIVIIFAAILSSQIRKLVLYKP